MKKLAGVLGAVLLLPLMVLGLIIGGSEESSALCGPGGSSPVSLTVDASSIPSGVSSRDQAIGVMTAMGESSLKVLDYGDDVGPDSRGLFQQRANGAWGSYEDRMDPFISATNFFKALQGVTDREQLTPTLAAHRTQRNADPNHYTKYWDAATQVVEYLSGAPVPTSSTMTSAGCPAPVAAGEVNAQGWALPAEGPITSGYGMRIHPISGSSRMHAGTDIAGPCGEPIWAAQTGTVTFRGFDSGGNGTIRIDHGGGLSTEYLHQYEDGMFVTEGDQVTAGQQIGEIGSSGGSTGCHLHFVVKPGGAHTDPVPFMAAVGISLG